jgi:predicted nucleic acid-binding protein
MILADTSVWVEHFRHGLPRLAEHLSQAQIAIHSVVIGELATGNLAQREETLLLLNRLPRLDERSATDCLVFIEQQKLFGVGLGWSDVQLLAAAAHSQVPIWSLDRKLTQSARRLQFA